MSLQRQVLRGIGWTLFEKISRQFIGLALFVILARLLGPADFGLVAIATSFIVVLTAFNRQYFTGALVQRRELEADHLSSSLWTSLLIGALVAGGLMLAAPPIASWFGEPELVGIVRWLAPLMIVTAAVVVPEALFKREMDFRPLAIRTTLATLIGGMVGVSMAFLDFGPYSLVAQQWATGLVAAAVLWIGSPFRPRLAISRRHTFDILRFGTPLTGGALIGMLAQQAPPPVIGYYLDTVAAGTYSVGRRISQMIAMVLTESSDRIALPAFSKVQDDPERMRRAFLASVKFVALIAFPVFIGVVCVAPEFVLVFLGPQWQSAIPIIQLLTPIGIANALGACTRTAIVARGRPSWTLWQQLGSATCNLTGLVIAAAYFRDVTIVAAVFCTLAFAFLPLSFVLVRRLVDFELADLWSAFGTPLLATLAMVAAVSGARYLLADAYGPVLVLSVLVAIGAVTYLAAFHLLDPRAVSDVRVMLRRGGPQARQA